MKTLVFGLDSADLRLMKRYRDSTPTLHALADKGLSGPLETVYPPSTAPGFSAFKFGKNAGKTNALYWGTGLDEDSYRVNRKGNTKVDSTPLWSYLDDEELASVVHNLPTTYPPTEVENGAVVSGFDLPGDADDWGYPGKVQEGLVNDVDYDPEDPPSLDEIGEQRFLIEQGRHHRMLLDGAEWLMEETDWDMFITCFTATDRVMHKFWTCLDNWEANLARGDPLQRMYSMADDYLKTLIDKMEGEPGKDFNVVVFSDHGSRPTKRRFNLNTVLLREGHAELSREGLATMQFGGSGSAEEMHKFFDWSETEAWVCPDMLGGGAVYINDDRFPEPVASDESLQNVKETLENIKVETGNGEVEPVAEVVHKTELYEGPFLEMFPDLVVYPMQGWTWDPSPLRPHPFIETGTMGEHDMQGYYSVTAPGLEKMSNRSKPAHILDLFPTILDMFDASVPSDVDGESLMPGPGPETREPLETEATERQVDDELRDKLENLGYM